MRILKVMGISLSPGYVHVISTTSPFTLALLFCTETGVSAREETEFYNSGTVAIITGFYIICSSEVRIVSSSQLTVHLVLSMLLKNIHMTCKGMDVGIRSRLLYIRTLNTNMISV